MEIERLSMCRICLVEDVRMYVVVNKSLQELYEKLTGIPFVTNDARPLLACFFCCTKLKQCCQFQRKCLTAEDLFAVMLDEGYEPNASMQYEDLEYYGGLAKTAVEQISIDDGCQIEDIEIKEEPFTFETEDDFIEVKKEDLSEDIELNHLFDSSADAEIALQQSDSEEYVPLVTFKTEVEVEEVPETQTVRDKERVPVLRIPRLNLRTTELEDTNITKEMKNELLEPKIDRNHKKRKLKPITKVNSKQHSDINSDRYVCDICQTSFIRKCHLMRHIRQHNGELRYKCKKCHHGFRDKNSLKKHLRTHTGEQPYKCDFCKRGFSQFNNLKRHILIHTGEKPYKCHVCERSFNQSCDLKKHMRTHTGEKPYECTFCERRYAQSSCLAKHIRMNHCEELF